MDAGRLGYAACMLLATVLAGWLVRRRQQQTQLTTTQKWGLAIGGITGATFAAKVPFILTSDPSHGLLLAWMSDGKTVLWGLVGGYLGVELAKWATWVRQSTGDSFVVPVAAAIAVGRLGCVCQGCCYGVATNQSWGMVSLMSSDPGLLRHPAPLYESAFHAVAAVVAWQATKHRWLPGQWMVLYMIAYSAFRFISESWRAEPVWYAGLTFYQCSAVLIGLGFSLLLAWRLHLRTDAACHDREH
ncbi:MAG: prolipoprotein diacylglyceryl transferase family protein [Planctomycetota bacterium]